MPDTPRTVSELKSIFADNSSGDISAQDMRDFVESIAEPVSAGLSPFHGWSLTHAGSPATDMPNDSFMTGFDVPWDVEAFDTDGYHSGSATTITVPAGLGGYYDVRLIFITGNGNADAEVGSRYVGFNRNGFGAAFPGFAQSDDIRAGNTFQMSISAIGVLDAGDTLGVSASVNYATTDIRIAYDDTFYQDTMFQGRYIGPA